MGGYVTLCGVCSQMGDFFVRRFLLAGFVSVVLRLVWNLPIFSKAFLTIIDVRWVVVYGFNYPETFSHVHVKLFWILLRLLD